MESWNYVSHGKGFAFGETELLPPNTATESRNLDMFWALKAPSSYEDQGFGESDFPGMTPKRFLEEESFGNGSKFCGGETSGSPLMGDSSLSSPFMAPQIPFSGEAESLSRLSSSVVESNTNSRESSLIDLKLGGFTDCIDAPIYSCYDSKVNTNLSSPEPTTPTKMMQAANLNSQAPSCQVLGCNKNLSASKGYHKRHRVCEVHSKTDKVVVNGIEQRFCQQCSRFHLLGDFDNGKRSCRKRLAGHNERRRKPKAGISSRTVRLLQPNDDGNIYHGTALASFICQDRHHSGLLHSKKYETDSCYSTCNKFEADYSPQLATPSSNLHLHPKHPVGSYHFKKQYSFVHDNGTNATAGSIHSEKSNHYLHNLGPQNSVSPPLFHNNSQQDREDLLVFDTASSFQAFPGVLESGCALSLLSSQSQDAMHSIGTALPSPMIVSSGHGHYNASQVSNRNSGVNPEISISQPLSYVFPSLGMGSAEGNHLTSFPLTDGDRDTGIFEAAGGVFQGSDSMNAKDWFSCEEGATIDLLQLSLQLQQVEHQKHYLQVKQENDAFCCLKIT